MLEQDEAITESAKPTSHRVLFVGKAHLSHVGGAEMSTRYLAAALASRGNDVSLLASVKRRSVRGLMDQALASSTGRIKEHAASETGCATLSSIRPLRTLRSAMEGDPPDVVVVTGTAPDFAVAALRECADRPTILYVRVDAAIPVARDAPVDLVVTNSAFMARQIAELGVKATFLPSVFPPERYQLATTREKVLFVNPVPKKGVNVALDLAEHRPDVPFVFSLSWRVDPAALRRLRTTARRLGNIEIRKATRDPARLFGDCRLLLVPSQWEEPWARVVSEAQITGIPAIASRVGGLPESVGPGGILVSPRDDRRAWRAALSEVWDHQDRYARLSELALEHSRRPEISVDVVTRRFEELMGQAIDRHSRCR